MENPFVKKESEYDKSIKRLLSELDLLDPTSDEHKAILKDIGTLRNWRAEEQTQSRVSPDTLAIVAGNILTVLIIVGYERTNVVTTKALGFLHRGKS